MSALKIKRLTIEAAAADSMRAGPMAAELARLLRRPLAGAGPVSPQRKIVITLAPQSGASVERMANQIAAELRRKLGQLE